MTAIRKSTDQAQRHMIARLWDLYSELNSHERVQLVLETEMLNVVKWYLRQERGEATIRI